MIEEQPTCPCGAWGSLLPNQQKRDGAFIFPVLDSRNGYIASQRQAT